MKKLVLGLVLPLLGLLFSNKVQASHYAGVEISYKHITGNTYEVFLFVIRDKSGSNVINDEICIRSSCFVGELTPAMTPYMDSVYNLPASGIADVIDQGACSDASNNQGTIVTYEVRGFIGTVTLPGVCADWTFEYNGYARNPAIDNIQNPAAQSLYAKALLNNQIGPNTSPYFVRPAAKRFCVTVPGGRPFVWSQASIEPDGDSIYYQFATPKSGGLLSGCQNATNCTFTPGYSQTQPMTTLNGISIDRKNGSFTFSPTQAETVVLSIEVEEWRIGPLLTWEKVGTAIREMQISILQNCLAESQNGPSIDYSSSGFSNTTISKDSIKSITTAGSINNDFAGLDVNGDSLVSIPLIDYDCNNTTIDLKFAQNVLCESIDPTDFRVIGPDGISRPIVDVLTNCSSLIIDVDVLRLELHQSLDINGIYFLYVKRGNDGNTLINECGFELIDNFYMMINVTNCPEIKYDLKNVTVLEDEHIKLEYEFDTTTFDTTTFRGLNIFRANNDQNFQLVGIQQDVQERSFIDSTVDAYAVDNQIYQYLLQMVTNFNARTPTNFVNSIVLKGDTADGYFDLQWNELFNSTYKDLPEYEVFVGEYDSTVGTVSSFTSVQAVGTSLSYSYEIPEEDGTYVLMVEATDPSDSNEYIAQSNWIILGKETPAVIPADATPAVTYVPNVITPNGDNINDRFYFTVDPTNLMLRSYSNLSLSIFNRWGKQVFQDDNYMERNNKAEGWDGKNDQTGSTLADGVYFYVAKFSDVTTGKSEERNGTVTLSASR